MRIELDDAEAHFSRYIDRVEKGETITLCRRSVEVAEIRPLSPMPQHPRRVGIDRGMKVPASFFDPLRSALLDVFEGKETRALFRLHVALDNSGR